MPSYDYKILHNGKVIYDAFREPDALKVFFEIAKNQFGLELQKITKTSWITRGYEQLKKELGSKEFYFKEALKVLNLSDASLSQLLSKLRKQNLLKTRLCIKNTRFRVYQLK